MNEVQVASDPRPRWLRRLTRGDWPHRIMNLVGSHFGGNAAPPGDWMALRYNYESAEGGRGCADSAALPRSLHYSCASITDDGFVVMFGYCHEWKWSMSFRDALRFALWMVFRVWAVEQWFGLRRWIYYRALHETVKPYYPSSESLPEGIRK